MLLFLSVLKLINPVDDCMGFATSRICSLIKYVLDSTTSGSNYAFSDHLVSVERALI